MPETPWWLRLKAARQAKDWNQEDLVNAVRERFPGSKLTQGSYSTLERGGRPRASADTIKPIAAVLGLSLDRLLRGAELDEEEPQGPAAASQDARSEGERLFFEDVEARTPHRLPAAREWMTEAREAQHLGTENWGRMVWFRYYLDAWNEFRKSQATAIPVREVEQPKPSESEFQRRARLAREAKG